MKPEEHEEIIEKAQGLVEKGQFNEGQALLERALGQGTLQNEELRAMAFLLLSRVAYLQGNFDAALLHLRTAQRKASGKLSWVVLETSRIEGNIFVEKGDYEKGLKCYTTALERAQQLEDKKALASCLNNIAVVHVRRGEFDLALEIFDKAIVAAGEAADKEELSKIQNNLGYLHTQRGQYDLAYEQYQGSLALDKEREDIIGQAICLRNISDIYKARGDYQVASEYLQKAYDSFLASDFKQGLAYVCASRGELCWLQGDLRKAVETLSQGIALCRAVGLQDEIYHHMLLLLAGIQTDKGNFNEAEDLLDICTALNKKIESESLAAEIHFTRGYLEAPGRGKHNLRDAKMHYRKACDIAERLKLTQVWIKASLGLVEVSIGENLALSDESRLRDAEERLLTIFERAEHRGLIPILFQVLQFQGLLAIAKGELDEALMYFDQSYEIAEKQELTHLAERARENYERANELRKKSKELLAADKETSIQDVLQYSRDQIREAQRMIQTK